MLLLPLLLACLAALAPTMAPPETLAARTDDGWTLPLRHYPAPGPPVLLVHGLGANHANFDFRPELSLADHLRAAGWDVWVAALRGDPGTLPPDRRAGRRVRFADHVDHDVPALLDAVLDATGADRLRWVGHSMGGLLLYAALDRHADRIAAGVAVGSPVRFARPPPLQRAMSRLAPLALRHGHFRGRLQARLGLLPGVRRLVLPRLANPDRLDMATFRGLVLAAVTDLPRGVGRDAMRWIREGAFVDPDGRPWLRPAPVPVLALAGTADWVAPAPDVAAACEVLPRCRFELAGAAEGVAFGHVDLLLSEAARRLVHPRVAAFLADPRTDPGGGGASRGGPPPGSRSP